MPQETKGQRKVSRRSAVRLRTAEALGQDLVGNTLRPPERIGAKRRAQRLMLRGTRRDKGRNGFAKDPTSGQGPALKDGKRGIVWSGSEPPVRLAKTRLAFAGGVERCPAMAQPFPIPANGCPPPKPADARIVVRKEGPHAAFGKVTPGVHAARRNAAGESA
ncbi:hypothetical protein ACRDNQ_10835 [Palleronia sp. KMU-117]|uniref:hypothetical protein n=1 Tax=Palleronia sp. KMU-117 TaxID=3434108 RepID=UPI003D70E831